MISFLTEIIGLTAGQVEELKAAPAAYDVMPIVAGTLPREAHALMSVDLPSLAASAALPALLLIGTTSPAWAGDITSAITAALPAAELATLTGQGHEAVESAPGLVVRKLHRFLDN
jgi:pimeloyl-ACP methyl ester carboxylesterase